MCLYYLSLSLSIYIYTYIHMYIYIYTYIYTTLAVIRCWYNPAPWRPCFRRGQARRRWPNPSLIKSCTQTVIYIYIYIYIYIHM